MAARTDLTTDEELGARLLLARRGQAYFSRKLNELSDDELDGDSLLPGWNRRFVVAHVGLNARALTRLTEWARTGVETPMYESPTQRNEEIELAATLPAQALRNLSEHAAIHLSVEWRDLRDADWAAEVRTIQGRTVPASETVWMRTREVWIHAVDLGNFGSFDDFPEEFLVPLVHDVVAAWGKRRLPEQLPNIELVDVASARAWVTDPASPRDQVITGSLVDLARWATGRGSGALSTATGEAPPPPPRWL